MARSLPGRQCTAVDFSAVGVVEDAAAIRGTVGRGSDTHFWYERPTVAGGADHRILPNRRGGIVHSIGYLSGAERALEFV